MPKRNKSKVIAKRREGKEPGVSKYAEKRKAKRVGLDNGNNADDSSSILDKENRKGSRPYRKRYPAWRGSKRPSNHRG